MGLAQYLKETRAEIKHVSWPTQKQTIYFTVVVIVVSILTALFLGLSDTMFKAALEFLISK